MKKLLPMTLQLFAEGNGTPEGGTEGTGGQGETGNAAGQQNTKQQSGAQQTEIDYEKLASLIQGKQKVAEETVLKTYLKEQGLTGDELKKAIDTYKSQKPKEDDATEIKTQLGQAQDMVKQAQDLARQAQIEQAAIMEAVTMGVDAKTIPYLMKLADLSDAMGKDGKIDQQAVQKALNKVLEDVPQLKKEEGAAPGFRIGRTNQQQNSKTPQAQVATKRWNRFN